ncbi:DUF6708 domain-containing protein [Cupriavidus basilensis]|uniref:DUF6708 domain-containing protein n=1 Tax=Cupriavidus basilensis TaxID=68895 RepID=UPI00157AF93D|nr:DUF6708 domain-containing protein [Cupriavidus basilensis]NUA25225.1 hypothetical protein [Cupriavidus basilensis]
MKFPTKDERTPFYFRQKGKPLGRWELEHRLFIDKPASEDVMECGNVYRIDSTCLEITDESQTRMQNVGMLCMICSVATLFCLAQAIMFLYFPFYHPAEVMARKGNWFGVIFGTIFCTSAAGFFGLLAFDPMRRNLFTLKRRPIRLNRKTRCIYAMRTKDRDGMWEVPWSEDEFFCVGHRRMGGLSRAYDMYDIRHYQLDAQGNVVRAFVLGKFVFTLDQAYAQWEYYRRYMQDGPTNLPEPYRFWAVRETFWEGYKICAGGKSSGLFLNLTDVIFAPFALLDAFARWLVLVTCSNPVWPPEIEAACKPEPNDPYARPYADDYIGVPGGPESKPSREDLARVWELEPQRRREGALTRAEAEDLIRLQTEATA